MNHHQSEGFFQSIKGRLQRAWGVISGRKSDEVKGGVKQATGKARQTYGDVKEEARETLSVLKNKFNNTSEHPSSIAEEERRRMTG